MTTETTWTCGGCGTSYSADDDADMNTGHPGTCDYADGAGQPISVIVKFSAVGWYHVRVPSDQLAQVTGGLPFTALRGTVEDGAWPDDDTEDGVTDFLTGLTVTAGASGMDGFEISDVYPAARDESGPGGPEQPTASRDPRFPPPATWSEDGPYSRGADPRPTIITLRAGSYDTTMSQRPAAHVTFSRNEDGADGPVFYEGAISQTDLFRVLLAAGLLHRQVDPLGRRRR
jgi:hypothetical protein